MSDLLYFRNLETGKAYKTGGQYDDTVWVLLPFGWIISTIAKREDLNSDQYEQITEAEI